MRGGPGSDVRPPGAPVHHLAAARPFVRDPEAVVHGVRRGAGEVTPASTVIKTGAGFDQHGRVKSSGTGNSGGSEDGWIARSGGLVIDNSDIATGVATNVWLIGPLAGSAINGAFLRQGRCARRITVGVDRIVVNQRFARRATSGMAEPNSSIVPERVALGPPIERVNGEAGSRLRGAAEGRRAAVIRRRDHGRGQRPGTQGVAQRPKTDVGAIDKRPEHLPEIGDVAGSVGAQDGARLERGAVAINGRKVKRP